MNLRLSMWLELDLNVLLVSFGFMRIIVFVKAILACLLLSGAFALTGCTPSTSASLDEEKEPLFLEGKSRANTMDYAGAIESFERALEVNPKSAAAHFELGCLCDQREADPAAAIYHYSRYLKLRPRGEKSERARSRITACQEQLAEAVSVSPVTQAFQRERDNLNDQIKRLQEENRSLVERLRHWETPATAAIPAAGSVHGESLSLPGDGRTSPQTTPVHLLTSAPNNRAAGLREGPSPTGRTHTVVAGETPAAVAKKYGVRLECLLSANPRLEPRRMRVGQILSIPSS